MHTLADFCFIEYQHARPVLEEHGSKGVEILLRKHHEFFNAAHLDALAKMALNAGFTSFPPPQVLYAAYTTACVSLLGATELTELSNFE